MNQTKTKLQYDVCRHNEDAIPVIIVAAGSSSRMQGINKQFMPILGVPVIARTLMAFEKCADISKIIIVTAHDSVLDMQTVCEKYMITKLTDIVVGGANRHQSVMNGIKVLDKNDLQVLIHDGARPFVDCQTIGEVARSLNAYDAALCVTKINDTVKKVNAEGKVMATVDRSMLYSAQTPQGVNIKEYMLACESVNDADSFTDDVSIMEATGYNVKAVVGSGKNIKITTPDDIFIAESIVKGESEE
ncbi:MAG: 2-C-methyl-D-erythritol 4-phosphate cytidylyltransferase [Clostridia bacterium]|nr:2-C-methyl-D-erythritol 4-phosphate cytidylyltransferase [Clostridia bacterium]